MWGIIRDITVPKRAQEAMRKAKEELEIRVEERTKKLRESENKFKILSEKSLVGIYIIEADGFKYLNPAFARVFDYEVHELMEKPFGSIVADEDKERIREKINRLLTLKMDYSHSHFKGIQKSGETRFLRSI